MNKNNNNNSQDANGDFSQYVRVLKNGVFTAFETVNNDWCVINTKMDIQKGMYIVETRPFTNCTVMLVPLFDIDYLLRGSKEIPVTTKWPLPQHNNSRSN